MALSYSYHILPGKHSALTFDHPPTQSRYICTSTIHSRIHSPFQATRVPLALYGLIPLIALQKM